MQALERPWFTLDRWVALALPESRNPFAQTGAIANVTFIVALVTGVLLLVWYVPSVHQAYSSLEAMAGNPAVHLVRSLHRYSSDACLLFVLLHALRYFAAARITGPRWLAWVTGVAAVGLLWFDGFIGYWLVWDQRGQQVAAGTARMLDVLPIFVDPLSRSFLTDSTINSLLFFIVFFVHMLVPLVMGIALWLHITRLSRPLFLTGRVMTAWVLGSLLLVSLLYPATSAAPARMLVPPRGFTMDYFYLFPIAVTDRLAGGALWATVLLGGLVLFPLPWLVRRARVPVATVDIARCNDCRTCATDCPYGAITMVPRTDGGHHRAQAEVDPTKCVGCGICGGSCDSSAIGLPWLSANQVRHNMDAFIERASREQEAPALAFACASSAAATLRIDPSTGRCAELPGYLVWAVPCAGWVHALTLRRAFRHGARAVLVIACGEGQCEFREGALTTEARLLGDRKPSLRATKGVTPHLAVLRLDRTRLHDLASQAEAFRLRGEVPRPARSRPRQLLGGALTAFALGVATVAVSDGPYASPVGGKPELVVSFSHPGQSTEHCRTPSEAEKQKLPAHMRRDKICDRSRADVRVRVTVDGRVIYERAHPPSGLYGDMNSIGTVHLPIEPGQHDVEVALGDTHDLREWPLHDTQRLRFEPHLRHVVVFDRTRGFRWF